MTDDVATLLGPLWTTLCAMLVFLMQAGFAMLEAGSVRAKNARNVLFKNAADVCVGALLWFVIGHALAYDGDVGGVVGAPGTSVARTPEPAAWFFQFVFAATASTIVSGGVAERTTLTAYLAYTSVLTGVVYPVVAHWVWTEDGWLSAAVDFAGAGVVHLTGGVAALVGAVAVGPRLRRFEDGPFPGHSATLQVLGTLLLWCGWFAFNAGSTLAWDAAAAATVARATVATTLGGAAGGVAGTLAARLRTETWDVLALCNGVLAGLVGVTAGCAVMAPWQAALAGGGGALVAAGSAALLVRLRVDDPLEAASVHGAAGAWGVLVAALCVDGDAVGAALGWACLEVVAIVAWVGGASALLFGALRARGWLRIGADTELQGLDLSKHGGAAYPLAGARGG